MSDQTDQGTKWYYVNQGLGRSLELHLTGALIT